MARAATKFSPAIRLGVLGFLLLSGAHETRGWGQTDAPKANNDPDTVTQTFYLNNVTQSNEANELTTTIRNMLDPKARVYMVMNQNAIVVRTTPDQLGLAQKLLADLDRPKKTYRLTYTMTELDAGKRVGVQHFSMIVVGNQRTMLKQGSKVPVVTGAPKSEANAQSQVQYLDVGMNFDATLDESANGVRLRTKVEQSSIAEEKSVILGGQDPIIRQTVLEGTSFLTAGKPLMLGSVDVPGSTRHYDIEVVMELVK